MIKSMTGFGKTECVLADKTVSVFVRSVNSKQLDIVFHLPVAYRDYELDFRTEIAKIAQRGKVDVTMTHATKVENIAAKINENVVAEYLNQINYIADKSGFDISKPNMLQTVLTFPGVFNIDEDIENGEEKNTVLICLRNALHEFNNFREQEGVALVTDILKHLIHIETLLLDIEPFEQTRISQIKMRIENLFNGFISEVQIDKNRFEQEMIYYLEKIDITEEKVRLKQHCDFFKQTVNEENPGRKLGFIAQEMGREINTLGSKANEVNIQRIVVEMKDALEKIKEQILNIL